MRNNRQGKPRLLNLAAKMARRDERHKGKNRAPNAKRFAAPACNLRTKRVHIIGKGKSKDVLVREILTLKIGSGKTACMLVGKVAHGERMAQRAERRQRDRETRAVEHLRNGYHVAPNLSRNHPVRKPGLMWELIL